MRLDEDEDLIGQKSRRKHHRVFLRTATLPPTREIETCETMRNWSAPRAFQAGKRNQNRNGTRAGMNEGETTGGKERSTITSDTTS